MFYWNLNKLHKYNFDVQNTEQHILVKMIKRYIILFILQPLKMFY